MFSRVKTATRIIILTVVGLLFTSTKVSSNPQCSFATCARKTLELNVTGAPVILPCDNLTLVNTTTNRTGNYSYCHNENLIANQSTSYFTLDYDRQFDKTTVCCYNHDIEACGVCYDLTVYYAPTNQESLIGPLYVFDQPYTAQCDSEANPPPSCRWFRQSLTAVDNDYVYEFTDDGSGNDLVFDDLVPITNDVIFENSGCTIHFPKLERIHSGHYFCIATNVLGRGIAGLPTIILNRCRSQATNVVTGSSSNVKGVVNETVRLTCAVSPAADYTTIQFIFNNTIYVDPNYNNVSYPNGITVNSVYHNGNCSVESSLIIENFSQHFVGEYSCSSRIFGNRRVVGNNVTFNVTLMSPEEKISATASDSDGNNGLIIGIPLAAIIILIIAIIILIVIRISMKRRDNLNILKYPPPPYSTDQYKYDAFVSHATDTEEFAEQVMRKGLNERGYKVQMPSDFMAGHSIDDNIIDAYTASRYVVILFSEKYSHNSSALTYAYNKLEMTRTNCLIPVMCGAMVPETLQHVTYADSEVDDVVDRVAITIGTPLCKAN